MREVVLFAEDVGHEELVSAIVNRLSRIHGVQVKLRRRSVRGGYGKVTAELKQYLRDLKNGRESTPDLLVVATDANCEGYAKRRREMASVVTGYSDVMPAGRIVHAIPDPHVERWALLDPAAFKEVLGRGCEAPDYKCERDRYKRLLAQAVRDAGVMPILGGIEHMEDIVNAMDLERVQSADKSFAKLLEDLRGAFRSFVGDAGGAP